MKIIVATVKGGGIGYKDELCYSSRFDRLSFTKLTCSQKDSVLVMGKNTFLSLPLNMKSMGRKIVVVSSTLKLYETNPLVKRFDVKVVPNIEHVIYNDYLNTNIWFCGGTQIYQAAFKYPIQEVYWTEYQSPEEMKIPVDTWVDLSPLNGFFLKESKLLGLDDKKVKTVLHVYQASNQEELAYHKLLRKVIAQKARKGRNGDYHSLFDDSCLSFDLRKGFPLFTSREIWFTGVVGELLFFLTGKTDTKWLEERKIGIWKANTSKEFLSKKGLDYPEGEMGPGYGFQWRHWGGKYGDKEPGGIDQITELIEGLKKDPTSRRHILSAWNVSDLSKMALPPCHMMTQFYVNYIDEKPYLDTKVYMRSCDMFHGLPFNVASYALLNHIICQATEFTPGRLIFTFGDLHVYQVHIEVVKELLTCRPVKFPSLKMAKIPWTELKTTDFTILNYHPQSHLGAPMVE